MCDPSQVEDPVIKEALEEQVQSPYRKIVKLGRTDIRAGLPGFRAYSTSADSIYKNDTLFGDAPQSLPDKDNALFGPNHHASR